MPDRYCFRCRQSVGRLYECAGGVVACQRHTHLVPTEPRREAVEPKPGWPVGKARAGGMHEEIEAMFGPATIRAWGGGGSLAQEGGQK